MRPAEIEPSRVYIERERDVTSVAIECDLTSETKRAADYAMVPFEVVPGTARLELEYRYEGQQHPGVRNESDLGLVDPRGAEFPLFPGFRGWSGNARRRAVLTEQSATPGYVPGPIQPGTWWVLLGLYKLDPRGVELMITVRLSAVEGASPAPRPPEDRQATLAGSGAGQPRWFRGDLHSHTNHSDACGSLAELAAEGRLRGLDFLAVTDHNTISHLPFLGARDGLLLVPGEEVTTYHGHMNVWGNTRLVDFRARTASELRSVIDAAHEQGAIVCASHPNVPGMGWSFGLAGSLCGQAWSWWPGGCCGALADRGLGGEGLCDAGFVLGGCWAGCGVWLGVPSGSGGAGPDRYKRAALSGVVHIEDLVRRRRELHQQRSRAAVGGALERRALVDPADSHPGRRERRVAPWRVVHVEERVHRRRQLHHPPDRKSV